MYHIKPHADGTRAMKKTWRKFSMLCVTTPQEAAASGGGIHMLSVHGRFLDALGS